MDDYSKYRGKCKEMSEELIKKDSSLRLVRGFYCDPIWNTEDQHWWCEDTEGNIIDPSKDQFPTRGLAGTYREFDGYFTCYGCGKQLEEFEGIQRGNVIVCAGECYNKLFGLEGDAVK